MKDDVETLVETFEYLDELRESGETNMYGAGTYLRNAFGYQRAEASRLLGLWMKHYKADIPAARRAREVVL